MDITELKKLAKQLGGVVVFSNNKPELVVLPYEKYDSSAQQQNGLDENVEDIERLNREIQALKEEIRQKEEEAELTDSQRVD